MYQYLSNSTADYNYTLVLRNQNVMPEFGNKKQIVHEFDDGGISITRMSDTSFFNVTIQFTAITVANSITLLDIWHDENKANGMARTFYWQHPVTLKYYTVRFMDILTKQYRADMGTAYHEVEAFTLRVEGNKPS